MQLDGRRSEPHAPVATFYSGIGRLVAHSGARVLPVAHVGLEPVLAARDDRYKVKWGTGTNKSSHDETATDMFIRRQTTPLPLPQQSLSQELSASRG